MNQEPKENEITVDDTLAKNIKDSPQLSKDELRLLKKHKKNEEYKQTLEDINKKERKNSLIKYSAIAIILLLVVLFGYKIFSSFNFPITSSTTINVKINEKVKGSQNAPVIIIEYSDFECPFCGKFFRETLPLIESNYINTGKVKFIYKHFPLRNIHFNAQIAAEASECANEQHKFWQYHDLLFQNTPNFKENNLIQYASQINLDVDQFSKCLSSGKYKSVIEEELKEGIKNGITGTPGFLINNKLVTGAQSFSVFEQIIESSLN